MPNAECNRTTDRVAAANAAFVEILPSGTTFGFGHRNLPACKIHSSLLINYVPTRHAREGDQELDCCLLGKRSGSGGAFQTKQWLALFLVACMAFVGAAFRRCVGMYARLQAS